MFGTRIPSTELNPKEHDVFERFGLKQHIKDYLLNTSTAGLSSYLSDLPGEIDFNNHSLASSLGKVKPNVNINEILKVFTVDQVAPNEIPITDPIKQQVKVPMGLVDSAEKKIILRFKTSDSKRKGIDDSDIQPLKKFKD